VRIRGSTKGGVKGGRVNSGEKRDALRVCKEGR
jgi:hypothetical protein